MERDLSNAFRRSISLPPEPQRRPVGRLRRSIAQIAVLENALLIFLGSYSVRCWRQISACCGGGDGPEASWPGLTPAIHAFRRMGGRRDHKPLLLRPLPLSGAAGAVSGGGAAWMAGSSPARTAEAPRRVGGNRPTAIAIRAFFCLPESSTWRLCRLSAFCGCGARRRQSPALR